MAAAGPKALPVTGGSTPVVSIALMAGALLLLPLCLCISIVYKTTRCEDIRDIPTAVLKNWITIVIGMYVVGIALLVIYELLA